MKALIHNTIKYLTTKITILLIIASTKLHKNTYVFVHYTDNNTKRVKTAEKNTSRHNKLQNSMWELLARKMTDIYGPNGSLLNNAHCVVKNAQQTESFSNQVL